MIFPSIIFLFCFFPIILFLYYPICKWIVPKKYRVTARNIILFIGSLIFYAYGEGIMLLLLLFSIFINWIFGILIDKSAKYGKFFLASDILINVGIFFVFKYLDFLLTNINSLFSIKLPLSGLTIPLGISFFTFQALSYVIDVYRKKVAVQNNPFYLGLYISLFPQLIAGPIVRYETVENEIKNREESLELFSDGVSRFVLGMSKKVLLADNLALLYNKACDALSLGSLSFTFAWLGAICYTLHIYYDFSGYSDMAIGLGKMFGFNFNENFNYPYISGSISEFWRRWHISLSTWFKDYVYIPLGGSKKGTVKYIRNILIIWLLTGLWHGAAWTYVLWGLLQFVMLIYEKYIILPLIKKNTVIKFVHRIVAILLINISMIVFSMTSVTKILQYLSSMFMLGASAFTDALSIFYIKDNAILLVLSLLFATPVLNKFKYKNVMLYIVTPVLFLLCIIFILKGGYSPFIYFNF